MIIILSSAASCQVLINRHRFRSKRKSFPVREVSRELRNSVATNLLCLEEAISITQAPLPSAVTHAGPGNGTASALSAGSTEASLLPNYTHSPWLSRNVSSKLHSKYANLQNMSYLAWSQQVTNWLCTRCIKGCKPDALTLSQKSISRLSSPADFWTFTKCLCLFSSVVGTRSGWAGFQLYPDFGPLHSCSECASSAHNSHPPEKRDPSPHPHTTALALVLPSSLSSTG